MNLPITIGRAAVLLAGSVASLILPAPLSAGPAEDQAAIAFAAERGRLIFELDRAAWVATDDMTERVPKWKDAGMKGYVVERAGDGFSVTFYGGSAEAPVAYYAANVAGRKVKSSEVFAAASRPPLTAPQKRLVAIREAAQREATGKALCAKAAFNVTVIPPGAPDGPADIYLMTPQVKKNEFPFGGHYRATVAADGRITGSRAFSKSCMTMPVPKNAAAIMVTHLVDPVPTEIHVFTSISAGLPVFVGITEPQRLFAVAGENIRLVEQ